MISVLIADDERLARETIKLLLSKMNGIGKVYEAQNGKQALDIANQYSPNVAILDIEMPSVSGIELCRRLSSNTVIIFATAYNEYAIEAFEHNAIDYILKPFDDERFYIAMERAIKQQGYDSTNYGSLTQTIAQLVAKKQISYRQRLVIRDPGRIRLIDVAHINYIAGAGNYAEIHLSDGKQVLHRETLSALESQLDPDIFVRIHRSSIVRRNYVTELRPNDKGDYCVILENGDTLTLSRRNREKLDELTYN